MLQEFQSGLVAVASLTGERLAPFHQSTYQKGAQNEAGIDAADMVDFAPRDRTAVKNDGERLEPGPAQFPRELFLLESLDESGGFGVSAESGRLSVKDYRYSPVLVKGPQILKRFFNRGRLFAQPFGKFRDRDRFVLEEKRRFDSGFEIRHNWAV